MPHILGHVNLKTKKSLIEFSEHFLKNWKIQSLDYDIKRCIKKENGNSSPLPALMYCFAIIDMMGALIAGEAIKGNTTGNSKKYLLDFMNYPKDETNLLWDKIFRHKITHLSTPETGIRYQGKIISWNLHDENPSNHLKIIWNKETITIGNNCGRIKIHGKFVINIIKLKEDIIDSILRPKDGYLERLKTDKNLQKNFKTAINQIYEVRNK